MRFASGALWTVEDQPKTEGNHRQVVSLWLKLLGKLVGEAVHLTLQVGRRRRRCRCRRSWRRGRPAEVARGSIGIGMPSGIGALQVTFVCILPSPCFAAASARAELAAGRRARALQRGDGLQIVAAVVRVALERARGCSLDEQEKEEGAKEHRIGYVNIYVVYSRRRRLIFLIS